ncbi:hypothetical protein J6I75_08595 [Pseudidiomarina sp. 1APP75-27a]|uniref:hypothetical protein n=1 Tax=Pseudidiomarina terrestris TaxID=2820060 RepID=UPI002B05909B|nr:hypothetical protein [Pseudidiomarina sp. 1APP75-27a]MEA3588409.1 hypothetical protein [Pseudidiomarina sp. 1APP75-27a]
MTELVIDGFPKDSELWTVAEFGKIKWNEAVPDEPLIQVILSHGLKKRVSTTCIIAKSLTSYVTKGSAWTNGEKVGDISTAVTAIFRFDSLRDFQTISAWQSYDSATIWDEHLERHRDIRLYHIPPTKYSIPKEARDCQYHVYKANTGVEVIISAICLFDGLFGYSMKAKQIVFNNAAENAIKAMEFTGFNIDDYEEPPLENEEVIGLAKGIRDNDRFFLFHLKTSYDAQRAVNHISAQLTRNRHAERCITVNPWFTENHHWKVKGVWLENGKRFFVLQILNFMYPPSPDFFIIRENHNIIAENGERASPKRNTRTKNSNTRPNAASDRKPSSDALPDDIQVTGDVDIWVNSKHRKAVPKDNKTKSQALAPKEKHREKISTSQMNQSNSDVGKGNLTQEPSDSDKQPEQPKVVPNAIMLISKALLVLFRNGDIDEVECLDSTGEWVDVGNSGLPSLYNFPKSTTWGENRTKPPFRVGASKVYLARRAGVFHASAQGEDFYFIAIERIRTESYRTGVYVGFHKIDFTTEIDRILREVESESGVWVKLNDYFQSGYEPITHRGDENSIAKHLKSRMTSSEE